MCSIQVTTYLGTIPKTPNNLPFQQPANYNYSYDVQDNTITLDFGHNEKRKDDRTTGSYHVLLPDGRMQLVEYEAGPNGYKPVVSVSDTAPRIGTSPWFLQPTSAH